jgi:hypothetical protein
MSSPFSSHVKLWGHDDNECCHNHYTTISLHVYSINNNSRQMQTEKYVYFKQEKSEKVEKPFSYTEFYTGSLIPI